MRPAGQREIPVPVPVFGWRCRRGQGGAEGASSEEVRLRVRGRGPSDISIRISDQGGGVPKRHINRYNHTAYLIPINNTHQQVCCARARSLSAHTRSPIRAARALARARSSSLSHVPPRSLPALRDPPHSPLPPKLSLPNAFPLRVCPCRPRKSFVSVWA
jgi:hypothetical protein